MIQRPTCLSVSFNADVTSKAKERSRNSDLVTVGLSSGGFL